MPTNTPIKRIPHAHMSQMLDRFGIRPTSQRVEIAQIIFGIGEHVSADRVYRLANAGERPVSKATVYNTLGLFAEKGLIREVIVDPTKVFYDPNTLPHHHIYNTDTGELQDIALEQIPIGDLPDMPPGTRLDSVEIIIRVSNAQEASG